MPSHTAHLSAPLISRIHRLTTHSTSTPHLTSPHLRPCPSAHPHSPKHDSQRLPTTCFSPSPRSNPRTSFLFTTPSISSGISPLPFVPPRTATSTSPSASASESESESESESGVVHLHRRKTCCIISLHDPVHHICVCFCVCVCVCTTLLGLDVDVDFTRRGGICVSGRAQAGVSRCGYAGAGGYCLCGG